MVLSIILYVSLQSLPRIRPIISVASFIDFQRGIDCCYQFLASGNQHELKRSFQAINHGELIGRFLLHKAESLARELVMARPKWRVGMFARDL